MSRARLKLIVACVGLVCLLAAGCGDDNDDGATASSSTSTAAADRAEAPSGDFVTFDETGPADDSLEPVKIGFVNQSEGTPSFPGPRIAAKVAVDYINDKLGGIDGHPVELVDCNTGLDPESNQQCAQKMVNDDDIGVVVSQFLLGADAYWPVLEQSDLVNMTGTPLVPSDFTSKASISFSPGSPGIVVGLAAFAAEKLDAKTITVVAEGNSGGEAVVANLKMAPPTANLKYESIIVSGAETDLAGALQAKPGDAVLIVAPAATCVQTAKALEQIGSDTPVVAVSSCADPAVVSEVPDEIVDWYVGAPSSLPGLESKDPELEKFLQVMKDAGKGDSVGLTSASQTFGQVLTVWEIGNKVGFDKLDRKGWAGGMMAYTGPMFLGPRELKCPGSVLPALCTTQARIFQITKQGGLKEATSGPFDPYA